MKIDDLIEWQNDAIETDDKQAAIWIEIAIGIKNHNATLTRIADALERAYPVPETSEEKAAREAVEAAEIERALSPKPKRYPV